MSAIARYARPWLLATEFFALSSLLPTTAKAAERIAVVLSPEEARDAPLAENLAEIAIARLAQSNGELVGARELNRLLERTRSGESVAVCLTEPACIAHLRAELSIASVVEGKLRREGTRITLELRLLEADTGKQHRSVLRSSEDEVAELVKATREGVDELFGRAPEAKIAAAPASAPVLPPPSHEHAVSGPTRVLLLPPPPPPPSATGSLRTTAAYGSAAAAALSVSAAVVFGVLARQQPAGTTRSEAQNDLEQQRAFATTANVLWISSGVFAAISVLAFSPIGRPEPRQ